MYKQGRAKAKALKLSGFLQSIIETPPNYADCKLFLTHLKSQGGMASLASSELEMEPISLNALKAASKECFDEGFEKLDTLRLKAVECLKQNLSPMSRSDKRKKSSLLVKINHLEESRVRLEGNLVILTQALRLSLGLCEKYVRLTNKLEHRESFNLERLELLEILSYSERR
ncbi:hypothetical protein [Pseudomonas qingdaonensis]|uniref:hypothetical protein n=1 Tax=Pseudomonas qingdaonensis TaxID=2056231 RepID=UPI002E1750D1|nr:hypothetical protein [Pseudomonas qingdaonensis]